MGRKLNGTTQRFVTSSEDTFWGVQPCWVFVWWRVTNTPTADFTLVDRRDGDVANLLTLFHDNNASPSGRLALEVKGGGGGSTVIKTGNAATTGEIACGYGHSDANDHLIVLNGDEGNSASSSTTETMADLAGFETGIGSHSDGAEYSDATFMMVCGGPGTLSADQRNALAAGMHPVRVVPKENLESVWFRGFQRTGDVADDLGTSVMTEVNTPTLDSYHAPTELPPPHRTIFPLVPAAGGTTINCTADALTLTANNVTLSRTVSAGVDALTLTGFNVTLSRTVTASLATLTLTPFAATVTKTINCTADALTLTAFNTTISRTVSAGVDSLTLTAFNVTTSRTVSATAASLTLTANNATVSTEVVVNCTAGALTIAAFSVSLSRTVSATADALTITGYPATVGTVPPVDSFLLPLVNPHKHEPWKLTPMQIHRRMSRPLPPAIQVTDVKRDFWSDIRLINSRLRQARYPVRSVAQAYTVTEEDEFILCSASVTVSLPSAALYPGKVYQIKTLAGSGATVTIDASGSETIDGSLTVAVIDPVCITIISDGTNWVII